VAKAKAAPAGRPRAWSTRDVVELAVQNDLAEIEVEEAGLRVRVVRRRAASVDGAGEAGGAAPATLARPEASGRGEAAPAGLVPLEAPMVGTFYRAPAPDADPFVREGDLVDEGQVLCIIEAMKLMNEIEAKMAGRVAKILVDNGQPVEYGQSLFLIEPRR
jgi:acetyl-CoA carboxylase biotin carboxyl carrier protein